MTAAQRLTRWWRIARLALHLAHGLAIAAFQLPLQSHAARKHEIGRWSRKLLAILRVRLKTEGGPAHHAHRPLMLVANHVSWLDIFVIDAILPSRFVAKAEVRRWPVIGWLCTRVGTLFIERHRRHDTKRVNLEVGAALRNRDVFAVFPEGTTTDGSTVLKFHASLLAPAVDANAAVQPVAVRFERADGTLCTEAAYDGDRSVWDTLLGITSQPEVVARVSFLEPIEPGVRHRRELAQHAREAILRRLFPPARGSHTRKDAGPRVALR